MAGGPWGQPLLRPAPAQPVQAARGARNASLAPGGQAAAPPAPRWLLGGVVPGSPPSREGCCAGTRQPQRARRWSRTPLRALPARLPARARAPAAGSGSARGAQGPAREGPRSYPAGGPALTAAPIPVLRARLAGLLAAKLGCAPLSLPRRLRRGGRRRCGLLPGGSGPTDGRGGCRAGEEAAEAGWQHRRGFDVAGRQLALICMSAAAKCRLGAKQARRGKPSWGICRKKARRGAGWARGGGRRQPGEDSGREPIAMRARGRTGRGRIVAGLKITVSRI